MSQGRFGGATICGSFKMAPAPPEEPSRGAVPNTSDGNKDGVRNGLKPVQTCYTIITASRGRGKFTVYNQF